MTDFGTRFSVVNPATDEDMVRAERDQRRWILDTFPPTQRARWIENTARRCTEAVLMAIGIDDHTVPPPKGVMGMVERIVGAGYTLRSANVSGANMTLARFIATHPRGVWYVGTSRHALAVVDGVLVDTATRNRPDGPRAPRRRVLGALEIVRDEGGAR